MRLGERSRLTCRTVMFCFAGVHVERDANLLVERALASLQAPPSDSFGFASVAQSDDNALPVANLFGSSPPPSPPAASSPPPPPVAPPQSSSPPSLPALSIPEAQLIPPPEESPQLSVAWHPLRKLPNVSESNESLDSMTIGGPTTARANHSSGNSSTGHLSSHASVPSTGNLATQVSTCCSPLLFLCAVTLAQLFGCIQLCVAARMQSEPLTWLGLGHTQPAAAMFLQGNPFAMRSSFESSPREPMLYPANTMSQVYQPMQQPAQPFSMQMQQTDLSKQIRRQRRLTCASQDSEMMKSNFSGVPTQPSPSPQPQMIEPQQSGLMNGGMQPMNGAYQQSLQQQQPRALPTSAMARRSKRLSNTMEPAPSWARTHPS
jgi:hypothetical protein